MPYFPGSLCPWLQMQFCDDNGDPVANGTVTFKVTGTATNKDTFSNSDLDPVNVNDNPLTLDANGRPSSGAIFFEPGGYDITVKDELGATVYTVEGVEDVGATFLDQLGIILAEGETDAPDGYTITEDDNTVFALPVAGGDYFLPSVADRKQPLVFINGGAVDAFPTRDGTDTFNGVNTNFVTVPPGTSPIFSSLVFYPNPPSNWRVVGKLGT